MPLVCQIRGVFVVHTARRCYRLGFAVTSSETAARYLLREVATAVEVLITARPRGSRSRNKVIVGEPAFGSLLSTILATGDP